MSTQNLQIAYLSALARIDEVPVPRTVARHMPIFNRSGAAAQTQAVKDAANALRELWKESAKKSRK